MSFAYLGMKDMNGEGKDDPNKLITANLYLEKAEKKLAKMKRATFLRLWDRELTKLGNYDYNRGLPFSKRENMALAYLKGRNGKDDYLYPDLAERGREDALLAAAKRIKEKK